MEFVLLKRNRSEIARKVMFELRCKKDIDMLERVQREQPTQCQHCGILSRAYKPNHSRETALTRIRNDILIALDNKRGVMLVLLDLSAVFAGQSSHHCVFQAS